MLAMLDTHSCAVRRTDVGLGKDAGYRTKRGKAGEGGRRCHTAWDCKARNCAMPLHRTLNDRRPVLRLAPRHRRIVGHRFNEILGMSRLPMFLANPESLPLLPEFGRLTLASAPETLCVPTTLFIVVATHTSSPWHSPISEDLSARPPSGTRCLF